MSPKEIPLSPLIPERHQADILRLRLRMLLGCQDLLDQPDSLTSVQYRWQLAGRSQSPFRDEEGKYVIMPSEDESELSFAECLEAEIEQERLWLLLLGSGDPLPEQTDEIDSISDELIDHLQHRIPDLKAAELIHLNRILQNLSSNPGTKVDLLRAIEDLKEVSINNQFRLMSILVDLGFQIDFVANADVDGALMSVQFSHSDRYLPIDEFVKVFLSPLVEWLSLDQEQVATATG